MLLVTSALVSVVLLLASTTLAAPSSARLDRRRERGLYPLNDRDDCSAGTNAVPGETVYSSNWAGVLWDKDNGTFSYVTGTFTVPTPSGEDGSAASVWVGIDGDSCQSAILQTGVDFSLSGGKASYNAWYEWYPAAAYYYKNFDISAGDVIRLTVTAPNSTSGNTTVENLTSGRTVSESLTSTSGLCGQNAEWIVEDFEEVGGLAPFANFTTVTFTNAVATGTGIYTPSGATTVNIRQNDQVLTSVSVTNASLIIQYV